MSIESRLFKSLHPAGGAMCMKKWQLGFNDNAGCYLNWGYIIRVEHS